MIAAKYPDQFNVDKDKTGKFLGEIQKRMEAEIFRTVKGLSNELGKVRSNNEDLSTENQELRKEKLKAREQLI